MVYEKNKSEKYIIYTYTGKILFFYKAQNHGKTKSKIVFTSRMVEV